MIVALDNVMFIIPLVYILRSSVIRHTYADDKFFLKSTSTFYLLYFTTP